MSSARALPVPPWVLGLGFFVIAALFFHFRVLLPGDEKDLVVTDLQLYYLPSYELLYGALLEGRFPLWNPFQICGVPQLGSLQAGFFYPGHVFYLVSSPESGWWGTTILHLAIVGLSFGLFLRRLGVGTAGLLAGAVFLALRGRYPIMIFFPNMLESATWLPLGALAVLGVARDPRPRWLALLAACTGLSLLAGYPQLTVYTIYSWGALLLILLATDRSSPRAWGRASVLLAIGLAVGFAIGAAQLLPAWELTSEGTRAPGPLTRREQFPLGWHGPGFVEAFWPTLKAPFPGLYLSLGWTAIAGLAAVLFAKRMRALALACLGVSFLVLTFAMGPATPVFEIVSQLPALGWFRLPQRALFMLDFFAGIAFAIGVQGLFESAQERFPRASESAWPWLAALPALLLVVEVFVAPPNRARLQHALSLVQNHRRESPVYDRVAASGERAWIRSPRLESRQPPKIASYRGMRSVGDYEPVNQRRQSDYFTYLSEGRLRPAKKSRPYSGRLKHLAAPSYPGALLERGHLLDVAAVEWLVVQRFSLARGELARFIDERGLVVEDDLRDPEIVLLRNPQAAPRAFVVHDLVPAPDPLELMQRMSDPAFDPLRSSFVEGLDAPRPSERGGQPARIVIDEPNRVEIEAELAEDGMLVLVDSWFPGWQATVDGEGLEILPVNHLFRGVRLPAGRHRVIFRYRPWTVPTGAAASVLGIALAGLLWVRDRQADELPVPEPSDSILGDDEPGGAA